MNVQRRKSNVESREGGFTLIETLVAITILLTAIAGPLTIATKALSGAIYARDQITAFYLAQEAVEYVRNTRDENILKSQSWLTGLENCTGGNTCRIDVPNDTVESCTGGSCPALQYDEATGFYSYTSGEASRFTRDVSIESVNDHEVSITVELSWNSGVLNRSFSIKENILNWQ